MTDQPRGLTAAQIARLSEPIDLSMISSTRGNTYIGHHFVRAELNSIFGFGNWDAETIEKERLWEVEVNKGDPGYPQKGNGKPYYRVCYSTAVRLTIRDYWGNQVATYVGRHAEANSTLPDRGEADAMALTSCESYALRRAAINLGDRFGLSLYDKGSTDLIVLDTLQFDDPDSPMYGRDQKPDTPAEKRGYYDPTTGAVKPEPALTAEDLTEEERRAQLEGLTKDRLKEVAVSDYDLEIKGLLKGDVINLILEHEYGAESSEDSDSGVPDQGASDLSDSPDSVSPRPDSAEESPAPDDVAPERAPRAPRRNVEDDDDTWNPPPSKRSGSGRSYQDSFSRG